MRRVLLFFAPLSLLACGCIADSLEIEDPSDGQTVTGGRITPLSVTMTDPTSADDVFDSSDFDRTISITFSPSGSASVTGDANGIVRVNGNQVTVDNTDTAEKIIYELRGSTSDGFFKLYSPKKQAIVLDGVSLRNPAGAAINNQSHKRTFVIVKGANSLADGAAYTQTPDDEDEKAAFFSEGQLIFSGEGSLDVSATGKAGITSDDYVRFMASPTVTVSSAAGHGVRGKEMIVVSDGTINVSVSGTGKKGFSSDSLVFIAGGATDIRVSGSAGTVDGELTGTAGIKADQLFWMKDGTLSVTNSGRGGKGISGDALGYFEGGTVTVTTTGANYGSGSGSWGRGGGSSSSSDNSVSAKGIKFDGNLFFTGATVTVKCSSHEGIESKGQITVTDGVVYSYASDDAVNAASHLVIDGGYVYAQSTGNDGLDSNGNCYIQGGTVCAIGSGSPEVAVDANSELGYKLYVTGGSLVAVGGLESGASLAQTCHAASTWLKMSWYALYDDGEPVLVFKTPSSGGSSIVVSTAGDCTLKSGVSVSGGTQIWDGAGVLKGSVSGGASVSLSQYSSGGGFGGPGGFGGRW